MSEAGSGSHHRPSGQPPPPPFARNPVGARIVVVRDTINTIIHDQYGDRLLVLLEERSIMDLLEDCADEEELA